MSSQTARALGGFDPAQAFRSLSNPNGLVYRSILGVLADEAEAFVTELTESDLLDRLNRLDGIDLELASLREHLGQLEEDKVLTRRVNDQVTSLVDLHRRALYWSLTAVGRTVQQALDDVAEAFEASGSLRLTALSKIVDSLGRLRHLDPGDPVELLAAFESLFAQQQTFQSEAERYIRNLADADDGVEDDEMRFQVRKQALRTYLLSFLGELDRLVPQLAAAVTALEQPTDGRPAVAALLDTAATSRDLPDDRERQRIRAKHARQWQGMHEWYAATRPRVRTLRDHARAHASGLTRMLTLLNMQRVGARRLPDQLLDAAAYIHAAANDSDAWRRMNALTGLAPAAHLQLPHDDPDRHAINESWLTTDPVPVPVTLRDLGQRSTRGRTGKLPDRSAALATMAAKRRAKRGASAKLVARFAAAEPFHLSTVGNVTHEEFGVLLDALDAALSNAPDGHGHRVGTHPHADLTVTLTRPDDGRPPMQLTVGGTHVFTGPDWLISIEGAAVTRMLTVVAEATQ